MMRFMVSVECQVDTKSSIFTSSYLDKWASYRMLERHKSLSQLIKGKTVSLVQNKLPLPLTVRIVHVYICNLWIVKYDIY